MICTGRGCALPYDRSLHAVFGQPHGRATGSRSDVQVIVLDERLPIPVWGRHRCDRGRATTAATRGYTHTTSSRTKVGRRPHRTRSGRLCPSTVRFVSPVRPPAPSRSTAAASLLRSNSCRREPDAVSTMTSGAVGGAPRIPEPLVADQPCRLHAIVKHEPARGSRRAFPPPVDSSPRLQAGARGGQQHDANSGDSPSHCGVHGGPASSVRA